MSTQIKRAGDAARRLNVFAYGPAGSGKTRFSLTFPNPVLVDFEDGSLTAETMGKGHTPMLQPRTYEEVQRILEAPDAVASEIAAACDGYKVETWVFDSATSLNMLLLGSPESEWSKGYGLLNERRERPHGPLAPSIEDYKILNLEMLKFFNLVRQMKYHTVITAHAKLDKTEDSPKGLNAPDSQVRYSGYPILTGDLKYGAANLADLTIYMEDANGKYSAHLRRYKQWNARHRLGDGVDARIDDPTFAKLWKIYEERRANVTS